MEGPPEGDFTVIEVYLWTRCSFINIHLLSGVLEQKSGAFPSHIALLVVVLFSVDGFKYRRRYYR